MMLCPVQQACPVAYIFSLAHAVTTTPAVRVISPNALSITRVSIPRYCGESTTASIFSRPAQCLLRATACAIADVPRTPFLQVLQPIRYLLNCSKVLPGEAIVTRVGFEPTEHVHLGRAYTIMK